jgi:hypothetical protein
MPQPELVMKNAARLWVGMAASDQKKIKRK